MWPWFHGRPTAELIGLEKLIQTLPLVSWDLMALAEVAAGLGTIDREGILIESADGHMFSPV
jgi:hypothetical protein